MNSPLRAISLPFFLALVACVACTGQMLDDSTDTTSGDGDSFSGGATGGGPVLSSGSGGMGVGDPTTGGTGGAPVVLEEVTITIDENGAGFCELGEEIEFEHAGYGGDGYVNTVNEIGSRIEWNVISPVDQTVTITVRYASESSDRPGVFLVDGESTDTTVSLPSTGAWTTWSEESGEIVLSEGNHRIQLEATTEGGLPNIDSVTLGGLSLTTGTCTDESAEPVCTPETLECMDATTPRLCTPDGQWQEQAPCPFACLSGGTCGGTCVPGERSCLDGDTPQLCDETGTWQTEADCDSVCTGDGVCDGECIPGERECLNSTTPRQCDESGSWATETECSSSCIDGVCSSCTPGAEQCLDANTPQTCSAGGTWQNDSDCPYVCSAGSCTGSCVPGDRECADSNTPRVCNGSGSWQNESDCPYVCSGDGVCSGSCVPGAKQCSGSVPQTCSSGGSWSSGSSCANGCTNGECNVDDNGTIRITDPVPGWASAGGGTTGGGQNVGSAQTVSSMSALQSAASGSGSAIILVQPGTYSGTLNVGSNKTIIGTGPGVTIQGNIRISGSSNIIIRNLAVRGDNCSSYDECRDGPDAVGIENGAHHVWLDHLDIANGEDGNCDITKEADYVTVSFTKSHYTYNKEHRFSNLISSSDDSTADRNKLRITYMNSWWGDRVNQRMPRGRFGKVHVLNCYFNSQDSGQIIHGPGVEASYIIEGCYYEVPSGTQSIKTYGSVTSVVAKNNSGSASGMNQTIGGSAFSIPYSFSAIPSSQVKTLVTASEGGAGNTVTFVN